MRSGWEGESAFWGRAPGRRVRQVPSPRWPQDRSTHMGALGRVGVWASAVTPECVPPRQRASSRTHTGAWGGSRSAGGRRIGLGAQRVALRSPPCRTRLVCAESWLASCLPSRAPEPAQPKVPREPRAWDAPQKVPGSSEGGVHITLTPVTPVRPDRPLGPAGLQPSLPGNGCAWVCLHSWVCVGGASLAPAPTSSRSLPVWP